MVIAEYCNYAANYAGNFIKSLQSMESYMKEKDPNNQIIYILPSFAATLPWAIELSHSNLVIFIPESGRIKTNFKLISYCKKYNIDILHSHFHGLSSVFLIGWLTKTKVIAHFHNTIDQIGLGKKLLYKIFGIKVSRFLGCAKSVYDTLITAGFNKSKTSYITNCIDFQRLDKKGVTPIEKNTNKNNLMILGTDFYRKGVDIALKAIEPIADKHNICLQIVSHYPEITKQEVKKCLGHQPSWVTVLPTTEYIGDYYRQSELFLSPSRNEGLSYAIPEAIYCNCIPIKTAIPSLTYNLEGEQLLSINSTPEQLRERIIQILQMSNTDKYYLINKLRTQVLDNYSIVKWGKKMSHIYLNVSHV